jgi:hypothetical protein
MNWSHQCRAAITVLAVLALPALAACSRPADGSPTPSQTVTKPLHAAANFDPSFAGAVACSAAIVSGDVVRVVDGRPGRLITTLDVDEWVKPATGLRRFTIDTADPAQDGGPARWTPGQHLQLAIDVDPSALPNTVADLGPYRAALADAARLECPYGPS